MIDRFHPCPVRPRELREPRGHRASGFTLLEVLTVIGIIAALSAIVAVAFSVVGGNARARQTRTVIESTRAMQDEAFAIVKLPTALRNSYVSALDLDNGVLPGIDPTIRVSIRMRANSKVRDIQDRMSPAEIDTALANNLPPWVTGSNYLRGDYAKSPSTLKVYVALSDLSPSATDPAADTANWSATPLVVANDGWNHGLRFVGNGLINITIKYTDPSQPSVTKGWIGPVSTMPAGPEYEHVKDTLAAPDGRPFWVSAGPDGSFTNGDDNVYSFEN